MQALLLQRYPRFHVRVVDDHSTDLTASLVERLAQTVVLTMSHASALNSR